MVFRAILDRFIDQAPVCVLMRATLENVFAPEKLDAIFHNTAVEQYTRELLFSTQVDILSTVVCRIHRSVHAAYVEKRAQIPVSIQSLYNKLNHTEPDICRALVRHTATEVRSLLQHMQALRAPLLRGYRVRILDGNHLGGTEHRLAVLRQTNAGALPGQALAVLDPQTQLIEDVIPCLDAHTQECTLLEPILAITQPKDVWIADRNFCTSAFLFGLDRRQAFFLTRQHAGHLVWRLKGRRRFIGHSPTGKVYEQAMVLTDPKTEEERTVRRITVKLKQATRDGETEIHVLTNVPAEDADACKIAELYRSRWGVETAFHELTVYLNCELNTLGYPPAALFAFCVAVASYNVLAAVTGALRAAHGEKKVQEEVSTYFLAEEIGGVYRGMGIAVPAEEWEPFQTMSLRDLARFLVQVARGMNLKRYPKHKRGPKKPKTPRKRAPRQHVATARLLNKRSKSSVS